MDLTASQIELQIMGALTACGVPDASAADCAAVMVETDLRGIDSHGIGMLPTYLRELAAGSITAAPDVRVVIDSPVLAVVDGGGGLGHTPGLLAMRLAIEKARAVGLAAVAVTNSRHYGAAGYYADLAAAEGLIGLSLTSAPNPHLVPPFSTQKALGTNPIAFSAPAGHNPPFALDIATTAVAYGKVAVAQRRNQVLPEGWVYDELGAPTFDADVAVESRRLAPLGGTRITGGHKGYGLAAMVEILCSLLPGVAGTGHFFLVLDPQRFNPAGAFPQAMDTLIDRLHDLHPIDPQQPVLVPGDPERATRAIRVRDGVPVAALLVEQIREACTIAGAPFLLEPA